MAISEMRGSINGKGLKERVKKKTESFELKLIKGRDLGALPSLWPLRQGRESGGATTRVP